MKRFVTIAMVSVVAVMVMAASNFRRATGTVEFTRTGPTAVNSGDLVDLGNRMSIAGVDIASNATGVVHIRGQWELALQSNQTVVVDSLIYWDAGNVIATLAVTNILPGTNNLVGPATEAVTTTGMVQGVVVVDLNANTR